MMEDKIRTLHLKLPDSLHRQLKIDSATKGLSIQESAKKAIEAWLKRKPRA